MDVATLKAKIKSKQIPNYLIFTGPEWKVQQIYIQQIAKSTNSEIVRIDSIKDVASTLRSKAFVRSSKLFLVRDDVELLNANLNTIQSILDALQSNLLIHVLTTVDKRKKYYKDNQERIVEFEPLPDAMLKKYIKRAINLSDNNCQKLIEICEHDYGRCLLEIDKMHCYVFAAEMSGYDMEWDEAFEKLLKDGTIYQPPHNTVFDLVNAVLDRKVNAAFDLLHQCYELGETTMGMLALIYNNAKAVLQIQTYTGDNLSKGTGLTGWQIKNAKSHVRKYNDKELIRMMRMIQKIELGIKTGRIEEEYAMSYLFVSVL